MESAWIPLTISLFMYLNVNWFVNTLLLKKLKRTWSTKADSAFIFEEFTYNFWTKHDDSLRWFVSNIQNLVMNNKVLFYIKSLASNKKHVFKMTTNHSKNKNLLSLRRIKRILCTWPQKMPLLLITSPCVYIPNYQHSFHGECVFLDSLSCQVMFIWQSETNEL